MKILLLVITIIFLFFRIKGTPKSLSKKAYEKFIQKCLDKNTKNTSNYNSDEMLVLKNIVFFIVLFIQLLFIIYYIVIGNIIGSQLFTMLSALEIITVIYSTIKSCKLELVLSTDINDYKFRRLFFLLNMILDYIYYPLAIYLLLK